jgi:hypothetical protein
MPSKSELPASASKLSVMIDLLMRPEGATLHQLTVATGWKANSVRGVMSGALKRKKGLQINSEKTGQGRVYRARAGSDQ